MIEKDLIRDDSESRKELTKNHLNDLLKEIKIPEMRKQISDFFMKDMLDYVTKIIKLDSRLSKKNNYSEAIEKELNQLNTQILLSGHNLEETLPNKTIMTKVKNNFRQLISKWVYKSEIVKRGFEKPLGYPGDYKMLEIVYDNKAISENMDIGRYFDNNFLKSPYAVAVRIRKDRLRDLLQEFINATKLSEVNILNIACGSCREVRELLSIIRTQAHISFTCLDWDKEALEFSQDTLSSIAPKNIEFKFVKEDVLKIARNEPCVQSLDKPNLIYSIGLIDYLPDRALKDLIHTLYQLLQKDGKLILTHKNREKIFPTLPPDWFCDWRFVSRNKEEVMQLFHASGISKFSIYSESDEFGYIYYFIVTKE